MNTIILNKDEVVEKLIDEMTNEAQATGRRGGWEVHVFPGRFVHEEKEEIEIKPFFHQDGNFYGSEVGHVCEFGIKAFFDFSGELGERTFFCFHDIRSDSRKDFIENVSNTYELGKDDVLEFDDMTKEDQEKCNEQINEWEANAEKYAKEIACNSLKNEIACLDSDEKIIHQYNIEWV